MKKRTLKSFIFLLFTVNVVIYIAGEIYWDVISHNQTKVSATAIQEDSNYGHLIKKYSQKNGLDWRFVASMIQAESSFRPDVKSSAGAVGLMQVLPWVAQAEGVKDIQDPEENVRFGVKHFVRYFNSLKGETHEDTLKMNLAAYNAGAGHVRDARKLAAKMGFDPRKWSSIEKVLPLLEQKSIYSTLTHGYCQGRSVITYVNKIFKTYHQYREKDRAYPLIES